MKAQGLTKPEFPLNNRRLFSIKDIADYLGRSPWTVAEMVRTGRLPCVKDGKRIFLDINDINQWIEQNKTQFTP